MKLRELKILTVGLHILCFRANGEQCTNIVKPFDWTFTTSYTGTLIEKGDVKFKVHAMLYIFFVHVIIITNTLPPSDYHNWHSAILHSCNTND